MKFPEVKIVAENSKKTKFRNNANENTNMGSRKSKGRRRASRRQEAKRTMWKLRRQRNEVDTMVDYRTNTSAVAVIPECSSILERDDIQIADSRATCHSIFYAQGGRNGEPVTVTSKAMAGDKQMPSLLFDLKNCPFLSKEGNSRNY